MDYLKIFDKTLAKVAPIFFIVISFFYSFFRIPFFDEAYAYIISNLKIGEIFYLTRIEGHPILWYLLLKITDFNFYPYTMLVLNWFIVSVMILFFWKKAPFNNLIKFLITFSYPFFHYFAVVARPYGLTLLGIFLLCCFYKNSIKRPLLFSFLIIFCMNTTVMGMFGGFGFLCLFVYDIFLNRKNIEKRFLIGSFLILFAGFLFLFLQFFHLSSPAARPVEMINEFKYNFLHFVCYPVGKNIFQTLFYVFSCILFYAVSFILFKKAKKIFVFLLITYSLMTFLFIKIYVGAPWHYYFYFVYLIAAFWLCWDDIGKNKFLNIIFVLFLLCSMCPFSFFERGYNPALDTSKYPFMLNKIVNNNEYRNSKLFCLDWFSPFSAGLLPYLSKNNIKIYDLNGYNRTELKSLKLTPRYYNTPFFGDEFIKNMDKEKNNYLITQNYFFNQGFIAKKAAFVNNKEEQGFLYESEKCKIFFKLVEYYPDIPFSIYKINVVYNKL